MTISWIDVAKIAFSSSILGAPMSWGFRYLFEYRSQLTRDGRYLSQRLAVILERFAVDCANSSADNEIHRNSAGHAGKRVLALPELAPFPADADWKAIKPNLVDRVMSMPTKLVLSSGKIKFWSDVVGDREAMRVEADHQLGQCGFEAWTLADNLRNYYKIPSSSLPENTWDFVGTLQKTNAAAEAARRRQVEQ